MAGILTDPRQSSPGGMDAAGYASPKDVDEESEEELVSKWWKKYDNGRKFDEPFRKQIAVDRRYAAGVSDLSWAVSTNIIGAFIDILVALLYARNPDVSVSKAPQVDETGTRQQEVFAKTMQIVISHLWKKGNLKGAARKAVRSVLSNGEGWIKATMRADKKPQPETEKALNDLQDTHARLEAQLKLLKDNESEDPACVESEMAEKEALIAELGEKLEVAVLKMFVIDFVATENMQVSIDVSSISDYKEADWLANETYIEKEDALARFPRLEPEDLKGAKLYYQKAPKELTTRDTDVTLPQGQLTAESAQAFTTAGSDPQSPAFLRCVEQWDRRDKLIRTSLDGVKVWAKEPYPPPYPTSRFYPYFYFAFYEVDGQRHAQSLSWRLYKLQDEYSSTRSNFRITRERSIPGVLFNATMLDETEAKKLADSKHQEFTALRPADPQIPLANVFAPKPVAAIDMRVFDPTYILSDMERISGVQEALSAATSGPGNPKTATEANIEQSGTAARTTSDRDNLENMLNDLAEYTAEQALQCLSIREVQRLGGPKAFWPEGMDIEDLFTLVEIEIEAGTTGKPRQQVDQQTWAQLLPIVQSAIKDIDSALAAGNTPLVNALSELIKETMLRFGDESDSDRFIPKLPPPGTPGSGPQPPKGPPITVSVSLKGDLTPEEAAALVAPSVQLDQQSMQPPPPAPGAATSPGVAPQPRPAGPASGPGPTSSI